MRNNKGQALVEFILVLPVFILLIISMVDFGNIILKKYNLEDERDKVSTMYVEHKDYNNYLDKKNISINIKTEENFTNITLSKEIKIMCPILIPIFGSKYRVSVEKSVLND